MFSKRNEENNCFQGVKEITCSEDREIKSSVSKNPAFPEITGRNFQGMEEKWKKAKFLHSIKRPILQILKKRNPKEVGEKRKISSLHQKADSTNFKKRNPKEVGEKSKIPSSQFCGSHGNISQKIKSSVSKIPLPQSRIAVLSRRRIFFFFLIETQIPTKAR